MNSAKSTKNLNKSNPMEQSQDPGQPDPGDVSGVTNTNGAAVLQEIDWNDPDLLNNPEKLMKLKFDDDLIEAATTPKLMDMAYIQTELLLQDKSIMKMFKKYRSRKLKHPIHNDDKGDQALISHIDSILAKIDREQEAGLRIYTETKNKPFWEPQSKQDILLSEDQQEKVRRWIRALDNFSSSFAAAMNIRYRRNSVAPKASSEPEAEELVDQLKRINEELAKASEIFDLILQ